MLPVVAGPHETKRQILLYTALLIPVSLAPWPLAVAGPLYGVGAVVLGALFLFGAIAVRFDETERSARRLFAFSILYLFLLFTLLIVDGTRWFAL